MKQEMSRETTTFEEEMLKRALAKFNWKIDDAVRDLKTGQNISMHSFPSMSRAEYKDPTYYEMPASDFQVSTLPTRARLASPRAPGMRHPMGMGFPNRRSLRRPFMSMAMRGAPPPSQIFRGPPPPSFCPFKIPAPSSEGAVAEEGIEELPADV